MTSFYFGTSKKPFRSKKILNWKQKSTKDSSVKNTIDFHARYNNQWSDWHGQSADVPVIELQGQAITKVFVNEPDDNLMSIGFTLADESYLGPYGDQDPPGNIGTDSPLLYISGTFDSNIVTGLNFYVAYPLE